jgi:hypothetical protein
MLFRDGVYRISCDTFSGFVDVPADCLGLDASEPFGNAVPGLQPDSMAAQINVAAVREIQKTTKKQQVFFYVRRRYLRQLHAFIAACDEVLTPSIVVPTSSSHFRVLEAFVQAAVAQRANVCAIVSDVINTKMLLKTPYEVTFPDGKAVVVRMYETGGGFSAARLENEMEMTYVDSRDKTGTDVRQRLLASLQSLRVADRDTPSLKIMAYHEGHGSCWVLVEEVAARSLDSVYLSGATKDDLVADIANLRASRAWYAEKRIPYRRGYMLHGPPGTGKTTFIRAIAQHFSLSVCRVECTAATTDGMLKKMFASAPANSIILLEDIDRLFPEAADVERADEATRGVETAFSKQAGVAPRKERGVITMSGLLHALDSAAAITCRIVFMTTNNITRLDTALKRCGRCDKKVLLGYATRDQVEDMFANFYPNDDAHLRTAFGEALKDVRFLTTAMVQEHFIVNKHSASDAVANVQELAAVGVAVD